MHSPNGAENLVQVGRLHLRMESEATPLPVLCQGCTRQGLVGKGPASSPLRCPGLPFSTTEFLSSRSHGSSGPDLGGRDVYICLWGLKVHHSEIQECSRSHWAPTSAALYTLVGAVPRLQLEFVAETGRGPYHEPSQPADIPSQRQPRENSRREEEAGAQATFQPLRDLQTAR